MHSFAHAPVKARWPTWMNTSWKKCSKEERGRPSETNSHEAKCPERSEEATKGCSPRGKKRDPLYRVGLALKMMEGSAPSGGFTAGGYDHRPLIGQGSISPGCWRFCLRF